MLNWIALELKKKSIIVFADSAVERQIHAEVRKE
jgi:hypothetical protein